MITTLTLFLVVEAMLTQIYITLSSEGPLIQIHISIYIYLTLRLIDNMINYLGYLTLLREVKLTKQLTTYISIKKSLAQTIAVGFINQLKQSNV